METEVKPTKSAFEPVIAVDFDGTLAVHTKWKGHRHLGEPVPAMVEKVKAALADGQKVVIFTARVNPGITFLEALAATESYLLVADWCEEHLGELLPITYQKSPSMVEFWDDRAVGVEKNKGEFRSERSSEGKD